MPDRGVGLGSLSCGGEQGGVREQLPAELDPRGTEAIAQEAEVTDAHEAFGQDVEEEAAQELRRRERHLACLAAVGVILPPKRDPLPVEG
jgi:hypothetical protein